MNKILKKIIRFLLFSAAFFLKKRQCPVDPKSILVITGGYVGDTFWALQVIPFLKGKYPDAKIHIAGRSFLPVLANDLVPPEQIHTAFITSDRTREQHSFRELDQTARSLHDAIHPDLVIDLMCNRYSAWVAFRCRAYTVGMDLAEESAPLYSFCAKADGIPSHHLAYRPRSIVRQFLNEPDSSGIKLAPPVPVYAKDVLFQKYGLKETNQPFMLIPGAGWAAKQWQTEKFHELAEYLAKQGNQILIAGSPQEKGLCESVASGIPNTHILCDSLAETVSFLPHCRAVIGNDSGVIHIAEALPVKVISLYCATNPEFSRGLTGNAVYLASPCPLSPSENMQYCQNRTGTCARANRMNISVQDVIRRLR